jgi:DHA2 family multidrug resistance protein-like MFS transporter
VTDELTEPRPGVIDGARAWWVLALLTAPCVVVVMDLTVLFLAMPSIVPDVGASATAALWITDVYGFLIAASLVTMGSLADRIGRRRALVIGSSAFGVASAAAALAPSAQVLIVARGFQGVAGAAVVPSAMALAFTLFPDEHRRARAMAVLMGSFAAGAALGPVLGGVLLVSFHWSAVFWLNVPLMALVVIAGPRWLPAVPGNPAARTDPVSVGSSMIGILALVHGVKHASLEGVDASALAGFAVGVLGFAVGAGLLVLSRLPGMAGLAGVLVANIVISIGVAPTTVLVTQIVIGSAPAGAAGTAAGASQAANELGGALGIAVLGAIAGAAYRNGVPHDDGLPDTFAGLVGSPGAQPVDLLATARTAFVGGVSLAVLAAAGAIAVMAVLVIARLRPGPERHASRPSPCSAAPGPTSAARSARAVRSPGAWRWTHTH